MNIEKVVFFNAAARGDVFIGRGFVKHVIENILIPNNIKYSYITCWDHYYTKDLSSEHYRWNHLDGYDKPPHSIDGQSNWFIVDKTLYFNTWYCTNFRKYHSLYGCSLKTISCIFSDFYQIFGLKMDENLLNFLPKINYDFYDIKNIKTHFSINKNKSVFISTSYPRSGQATTESLVPLIESLSQKYQNINFYITDPVFKSHNVFYTGDIIHNTDSKVITHDELFSRHPPGTAGGGNYNKSPDLIESSYFSTFCDVIIGKSTGTYSYSLVEENIKNNKTKFVGICDISLSSAGLHTIIPDKFYSVTSSMEFNLRKNVDLICSVL